MNAVSISGGKDSSSLLLGMWERGMKIDRAVFADTGVEFPEIYDNLRKLEEITGIEIERVKAPHDFEYYMFNHVKTKGDNKGTEGYSWPDKMNRWCTKALKTQPIDKLLSKDTIQYVGISYDERHRCKEEEINKRYPLVDWKMTGADALKHCYSYGLDWGGLYEKFARVSCWLCPMKRISELRVLYTDYPELWEKLKAWDKKTYRQFRADYSVEDLDRRFRKESMQVSFFDYAPKGGTMLRVI